MDRLPSLRSATRTFLLRLWSEGESTTLRGEIEHTGTGERILFQDYPALQVLLERLLGEAHVAPESE